MCARLGGDEFAVLLPAGSSAAAADQLASSILKTAEQQVIAALGPSLQLPVTAEGVETDAARVELENLGCIGFQLFVPVPGSTGRVGCRDWTV